MLYAIEFDLNAGHNCKTGFLPLISNWQDCKHAAESLGFKGDTVAHVNYLYKWGTTRPQGCFHDGGTNRFHFNEGDGGNSIGTDKILCKAGWQLFLNVDKYSIFKVILQINSLLIL